VCVKEIERDIERVCVEFVSEMVRYREF